MYKKAVVSAIMLAATLTLVGCEHPEDQATRASNGSAQAQADIAPSAAGVFASDPPPIRKVASAEPSAAGVHASDPPLIRKVAQASAAGVHASDPPPIRKVASL